MTNTIAEPVSARLHGPFNGSNASIEAEMTLRVDPEFRGLIPTLTLAEREQLEQNILTDGAIRDPVTVWQELILDGHNRIEIGDARGLGYRVINIELPDRNAAMAWIIQHQFGRRNLSDIQRAQLALKLEPLVSAAQKSKRGKTQFGANPAVVQNSAQPQATKTRDEIAAAAGVSHDTIDKVKSINANATPALAAAANSAAISIDAAAQVSTLPKDEQEKVVAAGPKAVKKKAGEIRKAKKAKKVSDKPAEDAGRTSSQPVASTTVAIKDENGTALPDDGKVRTVFESLPIYDTAMNNLSALKGNVRKIGPGALLLGIQEFETHVTNARRMLAAARPHAVCPYCNGTAKRGGTTCTGCHGEKWVTKGVYESAPSEMKTPKARVPA